MPFCLACGSEDLISEDMNWYVLTRDRRSGESATFVEFKHITGFDTGRSLEIGGLWIGLCPRCYKSLITNCGVTARMVTELTRNVR